MINNQCRKKKKIEKYRKVENENTHNFELHAELMGNIVEIKWKLWKTHCQRKTNGLKQNTMLPGKMVDI